VIAWVTPLRVAIALAAVLAVLGPRPRGAPPPGAVPDDRGVDRIVGTVHGPVAPTAHGWGAAVGDVWVWTREPLAPGERVAVSGRLRTPRGLLDPGAPDRAEAAAARGTAWELSAQQIEHLGDDAGPIDRALRWAARVQRAWAARVDAAASGRGAAALRGIVTGDRGDVPPALDQRWRGIGIYHVLSVSGLHLAVVAGLLFALLRRLAAASPWGGRIRPARWAAPGALVLGVAYTLITGLQVATVRALLVVAIVLVAQMLDRPVRLADALGAAAIALLVWRPGDVFDPSFQLSFVAAGTLALMPRRPAPRGLAGWAVRGATASAWVALTTAPITALHFHQVAVGGVLGNLVLTPVLELAALPLGLAGIAVGALWPAAGALAIALAAWLVARVDDLAALLAHVIPVGTVVIATGAAAAALVALAVWLASRARRTRVDLVAWLALCALWPFGRSRPPSGALRITFLDVGQGDAAIVELPDGAAWLVDAGGLPSAGDLDAAIAPGRAVAGALGAYGHSAVALAILSHPHPDHYLGFAALDLPVAELWTDDEAALDAPPPVRAGNLPPLSAITAALASRGMRIVHPPLGVARREAGVELDVWGPRYIAAAGAPEVEAADPVRSVNDNSLVVTIRYAGRTLLFSGDLEAEGEDVLVRAGLPHVDVVKVPHHGSPTSSSAAFVAATHPSIAVISCGVANAFGFPSPDVIARWRAAGADVERTDLHGAITVTVDSDGALSVRRFAP
jgi:competence protein ComEC